MEMRTNGYLYYVRKRDGRVDFRVCCMLYLFEHCDVFGARGWKRCTLKKASRGSISQLTDLSLLPDIVWEGHAFAGQKHEIVSTKTPIRRRATISFGRQIFLLPNVKGSFDSKDLHKNCVEFGSYGKISIHVV
jgi:hypothetical protein